MSGLLSLTFGTGGTGVSVFGGLWFLVAFFILAFFCEGKRRECNILCSSVLFTNNQ